MTGCSHTYSQSCRIALFNRVPKTGASIWNRLMYKCIFLEGTNKNNLVGYQSDYEELNQELNQQQLVMENPRMNSQFGLKNYLALGISLALISACSSDSNDDETDEPVVVTSSTEELKMTAIDVSGRNLGSTLAGMQQTANDDTTGTPGELTSGDNEGQNFVASTLALGDTENAVTTREGNKVTINPDEVQLCAEEFADTLTINEEQQRCETLLADLTVELLASDEEAGSITYLFQENPVVRLGYGNGRDSLALNLGGLKSFADANSALDPNAFGESDTPDTMNGEISFVATNTNSNIGEEAGSIAIEITQPVNISSADVNLSLDNGELFSISADSGSGTGELGFDIGAIAATAPFRNEDIANINLDGFSGSARLDLSETAADAPATITVSNLGIGRGMLQMNINDQEALQMTMQTFGFTVTAGTSGLNGDGSTSVQIDNTMDISLMINNATGLDLDSSPALQAMLSLQAPGGTTMSLGGDDFDDPSIQVFQGGPFILALSASDETDSQEMSYTINAGECLYPATGSSDPSVMETEMRVEACE